MTPSTPSDDEKLIERSGELSRWLKNCAFMIRAADCATGMILDNKSGEIKIVAEHIDGLSLRLQALVSENARLREAQMEATIAWSVCASIHREYAKGKDPLFKTRQADFVRHENEARAALAAQEKQG